jgi:sugar-specific transcriptional regulator TrmB
LIRRREEETAKLRNIESEVLDAYNHLQKVEMPVDKPRYRIVQGRQQVYDLLLNMSERPKNQVRLLTTANDLVRLGFSELDVRFQALRKNGLSVRLITQVDPSNLQSIKEYLGFTEMRHTLLSANSRLFIVDDAEAMTTFTMDDSMSMTTQDDVGVWTNASNYVKTMTTFFDQVWEGSISAGEVMSSYVSHKILLDGLGQAMTALNVADWEVRTPGKLMGESGFEQWFDLTAKPSVEAGPIAVLDIFKEDEVSSAILGLNIKAMDVKASLKILVGTRIWTDQEKSLAEQFGIQLLQAIESRELARKVVEILSQSQHSSNHSGKTK